MVKRKTQKVRFHRGDRRPAENISTLKYTTEMEKNGKKISWCVVEQPTNNTIAKFFFEEDAKKLTDFQNKEKVWQNNGGIPKFLWNYC